MMSMKDILEKIKDSTQPIIVVLSSKQQAEDVVTYIQEKLMVGSEDLIRFNPDDGVKILRIRMSSFGIKPHSSRFRVLVVDNAENLNTEQANTLLKTLEEPPEYGRIVLLSKSLSRIIPTIKSRCQKVIIANSKVSGDKGLLEYLENENFNQFVKIIKNIESEEIPAILDCTIAELKASGLGDKKLELYKKLSEALVLSVSTNSNRKLVLEEAFIWWKNFKQV